MASRFIISLTISRAKGSEREGGVGVAEVLSQVRRLGFLLTASDSAGGRIGRG